MLKVSRNLPNILLGPPLLLPTSSMYLPGMCTLNIMISVPQEMWKLNIAAAVTALILV
ncbi:hypothetical protein K443DRAFT_12893 [Laccaria amethystina LaAM-08-1]|uniref:Uncharacterized protein n=1 Tax=Laccaria amethystina LaAM-08-1 TaxID=1095629 RepID=A0A0C9WQF4_9AGAR|nr:hypothetical protein K443DRAFT_12893 [Laccaria amethystina LaAM-08-1]